MRSDDLTPQDLFTCTRCGDCCQGYGGTFVDREELAALAAFLHMDPARVVKGYCRLSGESYVLGQRPDGYCIFWDGECTIHPVKPRMCRRWPFIESVVTDPHNWSIMAGSCPGMRTDIPLARVRDCVAAVLQSEESA